MGTGKTYSTKYLLDSNNNSGVAGQVLSTTSTGIDWVDANTVPGSGLWLANGNDIYNSNSGNVGIGTTSPSNFTGLSFASPILDVAGVIQSKTGNIALGGTSYRKAALMTSTGTDDPYLDLRVATSGTSSNTTTRMRISANGNVGIGATNPLRKLHVVGQLAVNNATTEYYGVLMSGGEGADPSVLIGDWHNSSGTIKWDSTGNYLRIDSQHSTANAAILFSGNDGSTEYMRIASTGNVGIGTTSPGVKLEVASSSNPSIKIQDTTDGYAQKNSLIFDQKIVAAQTEVAKIYTELFNGATTTLNNPLKFATAQRSTLTMTDRMVIDNLGNVGIGTTSPISLLQVGTNLASDGVAYIGDYDSQFATNFFYRNQTAAQSTVPMMLIRQTNTGDDQPVLVLDQDGTGDILQAFTDTSQVVTIDYEGNVGIGNTSPVAKLDVSAGTNLNLGIRQLALDNFSNEGIGITFSRTSSDADLMAIGVVSTDKLGLFSRVGIMFLTGGSNQYAQTVERMRITHDGNVGIGTTSPGSKLEISSTSDALLELNGGTTANPYMLFAQNGTRRAFIQYVNGGLLSLASEYGDIRFMTGTGGTETERMRIDSAGNVGIGTTGPSEKLEVQDGNIKIETTTNVDAELILNPYSSALGTTYQWELVGKNSANNYNFQIRENGTPYVTIDSSVNGNAGYVGIGTTSPGEKLSVTGNIEINVGAASAQGLIFNENGTQTMGIKYQGGQSGNPIDIFRYQDNTTKVRFLENGNVGIGKTNPAVPLDVEGKIRSNDSNSGDHLEIFCDGSVSGDSYIKNTNNNIQIKSASSVIFSTSNTTALTLDTSQDATFAGNVKLGPSSSVQLDDTPTASTASGSGTVVNWSVSETVTAGTLYAVKTNGGWTTADADSEPKSTYMLAIALGSNATAGMLLQGFFYKSSHGFTIGAPLYISNTAGAFSNSRPTGSGDYVRIIGYATSTNYIYFDPDKTWVKIA